jgi:hypothetical protein
MHALHDVCMHTYRHTKRESARARTRQRNSNYQLSPYRASNPGLVAPATCAPSRAAPVLAAAATAAAAARFCRGARATKPLLLQGRLAPRPFAHKWRGIPRLRVSRHEGSRERQRSASACAPRTASAATRRSRMAVLGLRDRAPCVHHPAGSACQYARPRTLPRRRWSYTRSWALAVETSAPGAERGARASERPEHHCGPPSSQLRSKRPSSALLARLSLHHTPKAWVTMIPWAKTILNDRGRGCHVSRRKF